MAATKLGLIYSLASGIVLRVINPDDRMGDAHLEWVKDHNMPLDCDMLTINKVDVGATELQCPNLESLIEHVKANGGPDLNFGIPCSVLDNKGKVLDVVMACPVLYQKKLDNEASGKKIVEKVGEVGSTYNKDSGEFEKPIKDVT